MNKQPSLRIQLFPVDDISMATIRCGIIVERGWVLPPVTGAARLHVMANLLSIPQVFGGDG